MRLRKLVPQMFAPQMVRMNGVLPCQPLLRIALLCLIAQAFQVRAAPAEVRVTKVPAVHLSSRALANEPTLDQYEKPVAREVTFHRTQANLFPVQTWQPPPPKVKPAKPVAPPLPFQYMGRMQEGAVQTVFLLQQGRNIIAHQGEVLSGTYRVEQISESAVRFTYLPLNEQQILSTGNTR